MRLDFFFGPISTGDRPLEFQRMDDSPRGQTGTDNSFVGYARAMAQRGHEVVVYAEKVEAQVWDTGESRIPVRPYSERLGGVTAATDAVLAWNDVAGLCDVPPGVLRVVDMQVNDWSFVRTRAEFEAVDLMIAPSQALIDHLFGLYRPPGWQAAVVPNGCDPTVYRSGTRVPGRCVYASSPDRGLHVVLQKWTKIRAAVPGATLRIFYHALPAWVARCDFLLERGHGSDREQGRRGKIIRDALPRLASQGVEYVGGVSRRQLAAELCEAEVMAYPCDTVRTFPDGWGSEGFGVAVLEGCAAGAVPVITDCDAFGEVYGGVCPMVKQGEGWTDRWADTLIEVLRQDGERERLRGVGREFAARHAWPVLGERLETVLREAKERKS